MKSFLEYVADDILQKYGTRLSRVAVVFPNKRASLFLSEYLARKTDRPIWSPAYITISDLFRQHSTLTVGDPIKLICDLHKSFVHCTGIDETLDHFYSWGQLLLSDFDDIDKNMADARKVFANLRDIHELDDVSYLNEEQREMLKRFFSNFSDDHNTLLKERFIKLWSHFYDIYADYNARLAHQQIAYEGALYRQVAEEEHIDFKYETYLFVGFNMMQRAEQQLCTRLIRDGKAQFYWDFDHYYMKDNEAGHYIAQYLERFPNEFDNADRDIYDHLAHDKQFSYISAPTENIQARYIATWLRQHDRIKAGRRTAIVLCNEGLLQTVIHCLPEEVSQINITTGYPLSQTPVASLVMHLLSGNRRALRRHPYAAYIDPKADLLTNIKAVATQLDTHGDALTEESLFRTYTLLNRVNELTTSGDLQVDPITLQRLIGQLIQSTTIPFHGEPAVGLQVMGVLETRNLDFDHLLILSCNEGNMPKGVNDASFIPYSIRKAFGLTTVDNKVAIYAYYFHRLLQRAHNITLLYNNSTEDGHTGEMSRFMLQLMVESGHTIERRTLQAGQITFQLTPRTIVKDTGVMQKLASLGRISPTAINRYLRCQLQFYYYHVAGIKEPIDNEEDEIDSRIFGNIFHRASELLYRRLLQRSDTVRATDIDEVLKHSEQLDIIVDHAIGKELFALEDPTSPLPPLNGLQLINREVIIHYLRQLLLVDRELAPFTIVGLELPVARTVRIGGCQLEIGGIIDRLDIITEADGSRRIRVVDYKTGNRPHRKVNDVDEVFDPAQIREKHTDYYLQTMLYALIVRDDRRLNPSQAAVSPALLFIQHTRGDDYDPTLTFGKEKITDAEDFREVFSAHVNRILTEIFNSTQPFVPTADKDMCATCPYRQLCGV